MNLQTPTVALPAAASQQYMPDVINSLKRLERIGDEESQTVQKILDAASELSEAICKFFPKSSFDSYISGVALEDGTCQLGSAWAASSPVKHQIGSYSVREYYTKARLLRNDVFVAEGRDVALEFAKDISRGLLDIIFLFIKAQHEESVKGLAPIVDAADLLKAQKTQ